MTYEVEVEDHVAFTGDRGEVIVPSMKRRAEIIRRRKS